MKLTIEPYQQVMIDHLLAHPRAYAAVGMGCGKTASTLTALNNLFLDGEIRAALVVAPKRVARITWVNELQRWDCFKWMRIEHLFNAPPSGNAQIYLINYDRIDRLQNLDFCDVVVFDEISKAKSPSSKRINHIRKLFKHQRRWGLSGTPRPNGLMDLFAQYRLLDDGKRLGRAITPFREAYFDSDYMGYNFTPKRGAEKQVYDRIKDMTVTLRSQDYLSVLDPVVEDVEIALPQAAQDAYDELEKQFLIQTKDGDVVARNAAVLAGKLHQIAGGGVYNDDKTVSRIHDEKIAALAKIAKDVNEPVIVATSYLHERTRVLSAFKGAVDAVEFKGDIEKVWNSGSIPMLVTDARSLGHGLNLQQGGRTVIWFSPPWSRELYEQLNGRVIRRGQTKEPLIYRILAKGTIDEAIIETLQERGDAQNTMLEILSNYRRMATAP